jgi:hypothetical protein
LDADNPQSYSQTQLEEAHDFLRNQARRTRAELERHALSASGTISTNSATDFDFSLARKRIHKVVKQPKTRTVSKSITRSVELLLSGLRTNNISPEQIKAQITAYQLASRK